MSENESPAFDNPKLQDAVLWGIMVGTELSEEEAWAEMKKHDQKTLLLMAAVGFTLWGYNPRQGRPAIVRKALQLEGITPLDLRFEHVDKPTKPNGEK